MDGLRVGSAIAAELTGRSNTLATGTTDEAWEARLDPHLWGTLAVATTTRDERQLEKAAPNGKSKSRNATDDLLDEIELKKK